MFSSKLIKQLHQLLLQCFTFSAENFRGSEILQQALLQPIQITGFCQGAELSLFQATAV